ncbi:MAG: hypothetical protein O3A21_03010 [Proteobacteria bacterium]|nr:hypothetical protein [Pseudomonadota bacterium]
MTRVAVYDLRLSAGTGAPSWADEEPSGYMDLPTAWLRDHLRVDPDRLVAFPVVGDSMEPDLREDDIAFLDIDATEVLRDAVYALRSGEDLFVKKLIRRPDGSLVVRGINPAYDDEATLPKADEEVRVLGRVVGSLRRI